jgi:DNA polymerase (family 10)
MKAQLIAILDDIADLMEFKGENQFKVRAFRNAAQNLRDTDVDVAEAARSGSLDTIPGVGKGIAAVIEEFVETGSVRAYDELSAEVPAGLLEMTRLPGLGPKKALAIYEQLGITSIGELEYACKENRLKDLKGFGIKTQEKILKAIRQWEANKDFARQNRASGDASRLIEELRSLPGVQRAELTGDLRRCMETVNRLHILLQCDDIASLSAPLGALLTDISVEKTRLTGGSPNGLQTVIEAVPAQSFTWQWYRTTGSTAYHEEFDALLDKAGLQAGSEALLRNGKPLPLDSEQDIFSAVQFPFLPPETREGMGEIALAQQNKLPALIEEAEMRGMLHIHSTWSDGHGSIRDMALAAKALGYEYIAMCDHSKAAFYANGLTEDRVKAQHEEIDKLNEENIGIRILKGIESDILADGSLDYPDAILETFDLIVASVHSLFTMPRETMTDRIVRAVRNPYTTILGHATGRLLLARQGYDVDIDAVLEAAAEAGTAIEINANPYRLDLDWRHVRKAREMGIRIAINPDAHHPDELRYVRYGIGIARKGLLSAGDVVNTLSLDDFLAFLKRK